MNRPPTFTPNQCVILAIDPGKTSGWSAWREGYYVASGTAKTHEERLWVAAEAMKAEAKFGRRVIVVGEIWTPGGKFAGARTMQGIGSAWGEWLVALELAGIPKSRVMRVKVQTWRSVFATGRRMTSEAWNVELARRASQLAQRVVVDDNEADAVCIGWWATRSGDVARKIAKKPRGKRVSTDGP